MWMWMRTRILTNTCRSFVHKCWCFRSDGTEMKAARNVKLVIVCLQASKSEWFERIEFVVVAVLVWRVGADSLNKCLSASATSNSSSWLMLIQLANWTCFKSGCRGATGWIQYKSRFWYCLDWNWTASVLFINDGNTKAAADEDGFQEGERNFHREELKRSLSFCFFVEAPNYSNKASSSSSSSPSRSSSWSLSSRPLSQSWAR